MFKILIISEGKRGILGEEEKWQINFWRISQYDFMWYVVILEHI